MKKKCKKNQIILSFACVILSVVLFVISTVFAEEKIINPTSAIVLIAVSLILVLVSILFAAKVDYEAGVYVCRKCGYTFKPTFKAYIMGVHTLTSRLLKCPECKESSWCLRKRIN